MSDFNNNELENNENNKGMEEEMVEEQIMENSTVEGEGEVVETELKQVEEQIISLQQKIDEIQAKADEYLDGWQRARADFSNYKKRIEKEQTRVYQNAAGNILKRQLEVLDDLDRALKNRPQDGDGAVWAEGIELVFRKLLTILDNEGVTIMQTEGQSFDPNLHEAITSEESPNHESGEIIEVLQNGYLIGDRVLRPALVRVAR